MNGENIRVLIWGKTYPELSSRYTETVCTAGVRENGSPIRLYPVPLRYLEGENQYKLYDVIEVEACRSSSDPRPESYKLRTESIARVSHVDTDEHGWRARREWIFKDSSWQFSCVEELKVAEDATHRSLGVISPGVIERIHVKRKSKAERAEYEKKVTEQRAQPDLFRKEYKSLAFCPFEIRLRWRCPSKCSECSNNPHDMQVLDWGLMELARKSGWDPEPARTRLDELSASGK